MKRTAILLLAAAGIYAIGDAVLAPTPAPEHPGFVDAVLASRAVIAAIRLAIIFAAAFVVGSVVALAGQERWLTRVGPVEASDLDAVNQRRGERLEQTLETIDKLRQQLAADDELLNGTSRKDSYERTEDSRS
jgi:hypothetical protein